MSENFSRAEKHNRAQSTRKECGTLCCTKIASMNVSIGNNHILENINLHIHCGEFTAIIGPNGAGKSTLLKALLGEVSHNGRLIFEKSDGTTQRKPVIGYVPQTPKFDESCPISVLDLFVSSISKYPVWLPIPKKLKRQIEESLDRVQAGHLLHKRIGVLSGGELQRVLLALALEPTPELLLLDEPVSGIDATGMELFYAVVDDIRKRYDLSVVIVSHDMLLVEHYADRVVLLNKQLAKVGTPREVFGSKEFKTLFRLSEGEGK